MKSTDFFFHKRNARRLKIISKIQVLTLFATGSPDWFILIKNQPLVRVLCQKLRI